MLEARPAKRAAEHRLARDARMDVFEADAAIGGLVYDIKSESATFDVRGDRFTCARARPRQDERLYQAAARKFAGGAKLPANPVVLKDAHEAILAQAEANGAGWLIARGGESLELRRRSAFSRIYDFYRQGQGAALGWVGQKRFFTTRLHVDLPREFTSPFQIFIFVLLLDRTFVSLDRMTDLSA
jgi:hypothetical protein